MDKPRLLVRVSVALVCFSLGVALTLLVNFVWPTRHAYPAAHAIILPRIEAPPPPPCGAHRHELQPTFEWRAGPDAEWREVPDALDAPPPPPAPPRPHARLR